MLPVLLFQRLTVDLERSASISRSLGCRVAQCSLNGLADFLYRYTHGILGGAAHGPDSPQSDRPLLQFPA